MSEPASEPRAQSEPASEPRAQSEPATPPPSAQSEPSTRASVLDRGALLRGAGVAVLIAFPAALVGQLVLDDGDESNVVFALLLPVLLGFGIGGYVAARRAPASPLVNGALAALLAFALIQAIGLVRRLVDGDDVSLPSIAFAALLAYSSGLLGALVADRRRPSPTG